MNIQEELNIIKCFFARIQNAVGKEKETEVRVCCSPSAPAEAKAALSVLLDPSIVTHVGSKSFQKRKDIAPNKAYDSIFRIVEDLSNAPAASDQMIANIHAALRTVDDLGLRLFGYAFLCKDISLGVTAKTVNKALGYEFIPEFCCMLSNKYFEHADKVEGKHFYLTEKLDGCFTGDTKVLMADGTEKRIDEICLGDLVMSFNEKTKEVSSQRVINVFHNGIKPISEWTRICCDKSAYKTNRTKVNATKNHMFFASQGWMSAEDVEGCMSAYIYDYIPSKSQISFLIGSVLGDTSAIFDKRQKKKRARFCVAHKNDKPNVEYMNMVYSLFANHTSPINHRVSGFGSDIIYTNIEVIDALPDCFHNQSNYIRTSIDPTKNDLMNLIDPLAIAVWYIDDGSMRRGKDDGANDNVTNVTSRATIATNRYEKEMVERLTDVLSQRFGIECSCGKDKKRKDGKYGYRIDFNKRGSEKLFELIAPYIPSCMRYKLPSKYHHAEEIRWWEDTGKNGMRLIDVYQEKMKQTYKDQDGIYRHRKYFESYDIEVENNHTYFANGFAVHNCRCLAVVKEDDIKLYSRQGVPIEGLVEIEKELRGMRNAYAKDFVLDGELLVSDRLRYPSKEQYKRTTMIVRKDGVKVGVDYHVFDWLSTDAFYQRTCTTPYWERREMLETIVPYDVIPSTVHVYYVPVLYHGNDTSKIFEWLSFMRNKEREGVMINLADEPYRFTRTNALLKVKVMQDCDLRIIGVEEGNGKFAGTLGALVVDYKGNPVGVGSGITDDVRRMIWNDPSKYIGRVATIQYFEITHDKDGKESLRFPVFKELREEGKEVSYE